MPEAKCHCEASLPPPSIHQLLAIYGPFQSLFSVPGPHSGSWNWVSVPILLSPSLPTRRLDGIWFCTPHPPPLGESVTSLPLLPLLPNGGDTAWREPVLKVRLDDVPMDAIPSSLPTSALPTGGVADLATCV